MPRALTARTATGWQHDGAAAGEPGIPNVAGARSPVSRKVAAGRGTAGRLAGGGLCDLVAAIPRASGKKATTTPSRARRRPPCGRRRRTAQARNAFTARQCCVSRWIRDSHPGALAGARRGDGRADRRATHRNRVRLIPRVRVKSILPRMHPSSSCPAGSAAAGGQRPPTMEGNPATRPRTARRRAPTILAEETRRNLVGYRNQLQGHARHVVPGAAATQAGSQRSTPPFGAVTPGAAPSGGLRARGHPPTGALFGDGCRDRSTPRVAASTLGDPSPTLPKGTVFTCAQDKVISATSGFVGCQALPPSSAPDGRRQLIERGSLDGEYRVASFRLRDGPYPGVGRLRRTAQRDCRIDSGIGTARRIGVDGYVDNHAWSNASAPPCWSLLINDVVQLVIPDPDQWTSGDTIVLPSTTRLTQAGREGAGQHHQYPAADLPEPGGIVGIYVARDVDFVGLPV